MSNWKKLPLKFGEINITRVKWGPRKGMLKVTASKGSIAFLNEQKPVYFLSISECLAFINRKASEIVEWVV